MENLTQKSCDIYWSKKAELVEKSKTLGGRLEIAKDAHKKIGQYVTSVDDAIHHLAMFYSQENLDGNQTRKLEMGNKNDT